MNARNYVVDAKQGSLLSEALKIRNAAFALNRETGAEFARELASEWKERGIPGIAVACWALSKRLEEVPGSHSIYIAARTLAGKAA